MSIDALRWAFDLDLPTGPKFLMVVLADHADERHTCYPGMKRLGARTGLSPSGVRLALRQLESEYKLLSIISRGTGTESSRYRLNVGCSPAVPWIKKPKAQPETLPHGVSLSDTPDADAGGVSLSEPLGVTDCAPGASLSGGGGITECTQTTSEPPFNHHLTTKPLLELVAAQDLSAPTQVAVANLVLVEAAPPSGREPRAYRLPANWKPNAGDLDYAAKFNLDAAELAEEFCDWWWAASGSDARKTNWSLTWKTWCRRNAKRRGVSRGSNSLALPLPLPKEINGWIVKEVLDHCGELLMVVDPDAVWPGFSEVVVKMLEGGAEADRDVYPVMRDVGRQGSKTIQTAGYFSFAISKRRRAAA